MVRQSPGVERTRSRGNAIPDGRHDAGYPLWCTGW